MALCTAGGVINGRQSHEILRGRLPAALLLLALMSAPAFAADAPHAPSELLFVLQIAVLLLVGRLLGEAMLRMKQPAVMGQLIAGLLLGPSVLGALFPHFQHALFPAAKEQKAMIDAIAQFGILMLLLLTGMETDLEDRAPERTRVGLCLARRSSPCRLCAASR